LLSGWIVGLNEFRTAVEETFDVKPSPDLRFPEVVGFQKEVINHTFVAPANASRPGPANGSWPHLQSALDSLNVISPGAGSLSFDQLFIAGP
jgi:hypothetical protein